MADIKYGAAGVLYTPTSMGEQVSRFLEAAGFDFLVHWDQHNTTIPRSIWTPDLVPAAAGIDGDAMMEPFPVATAAALATERIEIFTTCDAIRRAPAVLAQLALTLSHYAEGRYVMCLGAGEEKQFGPYGLKRERPFKHLYEALRVIRLLLESSDPVDYDGELFTLRDAVISLEPYEGRAPDIVAIGANPKVPRYAGELCDGWLTNPSFHESPEQFAGDVATMRRAAEEAGRDPDALRVVAGFACIIREGAELDAVCANPALRWDAAAMTHGPEMWARVGVPNPLGEDFAYARDLVPMAWSREAALDIANQVSPEVVRQLKICGGPSEVAKQIQPWIEAGCNHVLVYDYGDLVTAAGPAEALAGMGRVFEVVNTLREHNGQPAGPSLADAVGAVGMA